MRALTVEELPSPDTIISIPSGRKAPKLPNPLKELDRMLSVKSRKATRPKSRKGRSRSGE
jgi:hypothetical protein